MEDCVYFSVTSSMPLPISAFLNSMVGSVEPYNYVFDFLVDLIGDLSIRQSSVLHILRGGFPRMMVCRAFQRPC